jgi:hypothetical protein
VIRLASTAAMRFVLGAAMPLATLVAGCGPEVVRVDRTGGVAMRLYWEEPGEAAGGGRSAYYEVAEDGAFRAGGGRLAQERRTDFRTALADADVAEFLDLVRAARHDVPPTEAAGGERARFEIEFRENGSWTPGPAEGVAVEALRAWCAGVALRRFDATIDALPEPGRRAR